MTARKTNAAAITRWTVASCRVALPGSTVSAATTAVTRARKELIVVGSEESVRAAVARPVARASGLRGLLARD